MTQAIQRTNTKYHNNHFRRVLDTAALLMKTDSDQVGRSYGRVIVYCSNFERTTADALFFESLLCLARMVVAAAVAEPSLASEVGGAQEELLEETQKNTRMLSASQRRLRSATVSLVHDKESTVFHECRDRRVLPPNEVA